MQGSVLVRSACSARVTVLGLSVCVCVCVCLLPRFSATTHNRTSNKSYQRLQCDTGKVFKMEFSLKMFRSNVMALFA